MSLARDLESMDIKESEAGSSLRAMRTDIDSGSRVNGIRNTLRPRLCAHCRELFEVHVCWVCLARKPAPRKAMCRRCQNAMDALSRYWRDIGQPLTWRDAS